jgi:hypothetical protein
LPAHEHAYIIRLLAKERTRMPYFVFYWDGEIVEHLAANGISPEEFEAVVSQPERRHYSRSTGRPCCWGECQDGRYVLCVYEYIDELTILPVTAFEVRRPTR